MYLHTFEACKKLELIVFLRVPVCCGSTVVFLYLKLNYDKLTPLRCRDVLPIWRLTGLGLRLVQGRRVLIEP